MTKQKMRLQQLSLLGVFVLFAIALFSFESQSLFASQGSQTLKVWFFAIGQGDAIFLELPTGEQMLIDGGPDDSVLSKIGSVMPPWDRSIDVLVATHPDADHITGLVSVLDRYEVDRVIENGDVAGTEVSDALSEAIKQERADHVIVRAGEVLTFGEVQLEIVWPTEEKMEDRDSDRNASSVVILLTYGETTLLLTGDAEEGVELAIAEQVGDIDVLKVGHHGSISSSSVDFLDVVEPEVAIISVGEDNRYGHPHPIVLDRLQDRQVQIYRTDYAGDILIITDGDDLVVDYAPLSF